MFNFFNELKIVTLSKRLLDIKRWPWRFREKEQHNLKFVLPSVKKKQRYEQHMRSYLNACA